MKYVYEQNFQEVLGNKQFISGKALIMPFIGKKATTNMRHNFSHRHMVFKTRTKV